MTVKQILVGKAGSSATPLTLIQGDSNTQIVQMIVQRYYGGVDLGGLTWDVVFENGEGKTDTHYLTDVKVGDANISCNWKPHGLATQAAGMTKFQLEGYAEDNSGATAMVWQSGAYYFNVTEDMNYVPGEGESEALTDVHKLIMYVDKELPGVVQAGTDAAAAAAAANAAAAEANAATAQAVPAAEAANAAAQSANAEAAAADKATARATNAAEEAEQARDNIQADLESLKERMPVVGSDPETHYVLEQSDIDDTLSVAGKVADAKVVGDRFGKLSAEIGAMQYRITDVIKHTYALTKTTTINIPVDMKAGEAYHIDFLEYAGENWDYCTLYLMRSDGTYTQLKKPNNYANYFIGDSVDFVAGEPYETMRFYVKLSAENSDPVDFVFNFYEVHDSIEKGVANLTNGGGVNLLVLGDSYSEQGRYLTELMKMVKINSVVNLGVSSAKLKNSSNDLAQYPYNDRPLSNDSRGGNVNTFGSQILKLKRLMTGTDLDSGETRIYTDKSLYPDVIFIQGGTNDAPDTAEQEAAYADQHWQQITAYRKSTATSAVTIGYVYIKPDVTSIDRTSFAGAVRYIYDELHTLFPNALIYAITPTGLSYFSQSNQYSYIDKGRQIKTACNYLGIPVIDWGAEGRLNYNDIVMTGSGTEDDPYITHGSGLYTDDGLHPNEAGAYLLALPIAEKIKNDAFVLNTTERPV